MTVKNILIDGKEEYKSGCYPTDPFPILEPHDQKIAKLSIFEKRLEAKTFERVSRVKFGRLWSIYMS